MNPRNQLPSVWTAAQVQAWERYRDDWCKWHEIACNVLGGVGRLKRQVLTLKTPHQWLHSYTRDRQFGGVPTRLFSVWLQANRRLLPSLSAEQNRAALSHAVFAAVFGLDAEGYALQQVNRMRIELRAADHKTTDKTTNKKGPNHP